jgi:hypothetical protein
VKRCFALLDSPITLQPTHLIYLTINMAVIVTIAHIAMTVFMEYAFTMTSSGRAIHTYDNYGFIAQISVVEI